MNILVVDDEKEIADVIELYLQNDQYNVFKFYTGQEASGFPEEYQSGHGDPGHYAAGCGRVPDP